MNIKNRVSILLLIFVLLLSSCAPSIVVTETQTPAPTATVVPSPMPRPEVNVSLHKPVRVSASWVVDPPERAVNGNTNDWWGAGGPAPAWIEVDLEGVYTVSRINIIVEGPVQQADYRIWGCGPDTENILLYSTKLSVSKGQSLQFSPDKPLEGISTVRLEIDNSGSAWVGIREMQVFSREDPQPLPAMAEQTPLYLAGVDADKLATITKENAILMRPLAVYGRGPVNDMAWSKDGKVLAVASPLGVWLYDSGNLKSTPRFLEGHNRDILTVAFKPDGKSLLSGSQDGTVKEWDATTGQLIQTFYLWNDFSHEVGNAPRESEVWSIAFSPDGKTVATGTYDGTIRLWELQTGKKQTYPAGHKRQVYHLEFSPDGSWLGSSAIDGSLIVWDVAAGKQRQNLSGQGFVQTFAFSPDSRTLAYGGVKMNVRLWDTSTGEQSDELKQHPNVLNLAFVPDGSALVISSLEGPLQVWDVESRASRVLHEKVGRTAQMAISPDSSTLATTMWGGVLQFWDMTNGDQLDALMLHTSPISTVAFSPDGKTVASGGDDGIVWLWDTKKNSIWGALLGHRSGVTGVAFSPDGKLIATSSFDQTVRVWNARTMKQVYVLSGQESYVRCVAFSPDGKTVASGSTDRTVRLWDATTGKETVALKGHTGEIEGVVFSRDGAWLASASADKTIRIWNVTEQKEAAVLTGNLSFVNDIDFHPDGTQLVTAGADHSLRFWDWHVSSGKGTGLQQSISRGHPGWILSVDYSPDGRLIASANLSSTSYYVTPGEIHLYSSDTAYPYVLLRGHTKRVTSVAFSTDGKMLASGSADGSVRIWGVVSDGSKSLTQNEATEPAATLTATTHQLVSLTAATVPLNLPKSGNLALNQRTSTSHSESARPSKYAVDGNTKTDWGSGDFPPQWIEIDLGAPATIKTFHLLVTQYPNGNTVHRILVRSPAGEFIEVHRFEQSTSSGQWLYFTPPQPIENIQFVRIETLKSPSWVGWVEIEVVGER